MYFVFTFLFQCQQIKLNYVLTTNMVTTSRQQNKNCLTLNYCGLYKSMLDLQKTRLPVELDGTIDFTQ